MSHEHGLRPVEVLRRTIRGVVSLGGGQIASQILYIAGTIALARLLTPAEFGLVAILTFFLALLTALGDLGLGMSLVRRPSEPSDAEYRAVATFQQTVAVCVAVAAVVATPLAVRAYDLRPADWWLLPTMAVAILADSVRFLPLARLERRLAFERIGAIEIAQAVVFNAVLLSLAYQGFRVGCFPIAVAVRSITGAALALAAGPPRLGGWSWQWSTARRHLELGLPYQGVHLITVLKNSIVPIFIGLLLGRAAVGHLEWAAMVAGFPLTGLSLFQRLYVGSFARLQGHHEELRKLVTHVVTAAHAVVAPIGVLTLVLIDPIVRLVFGEQWLPATPLFFWLWLGCLAVPTLAPLSGLLHALGHSRTVFRATVAGTFLTWIVGVPLALAFGEIGIAIAGIAVHVAGLAIWREAQRLVGFTVLPRAMLIWSCAAVAGGVAAWWRTALPISTVTQLLLCGAVASAAYAFTLAIVALTILRPIREVLAASVSRGPITGVRLTGR